MAKPRTIACFRRLDPASGRTSYRTVERLPSMPARFYSRQGHARRRLSGLARIKDVGAHATALRRSRALI